MIEQEGIVSNIEGGFVCVKIVQNTACASCHANAACGISEQKEKIIEVPLSNQVFALGDVVLLTGSSSMGLQAVLYAFVLPIVLVFLSLIIISHFFESEELMAIFAISVLAIYYLTLYFLRDEFKKKFVFTVSKCLKQNL
ncbi:hypothetical protein AwDysgo_09800 [Bacteroidales bacterium]|nr:hypothetical protein AwDysgo_09800 [Bacteroidales bacterium]